MVAKSHGPRRRTREKLRGAEKFNVNRYLRQFSEGQAVAIKINSSSAAMPFRRFHGLTGRIAGKRGQAYIVKIYDGKKQKHVIAKPEHLKAI